MTDHAASNPAEFWDGHYAKREQVWSGRPNPLLVSEVEGFEWGCALDLGCGEGADAIWLARRGWRVTAVDVSRVALDRAAAAAKRAGVGHLIEWQLHDLASTFPTGTFDLVSAQYLHAPIELPREEILLRAAAAVSPGGTLLVVGHASGPSWAPQGHAHENFPTPEEVVQALKLPAGEWTIDCEVRERDIVGPRGEQGTISDSLVKARRSMSPADESLREAGPDALAVGMNRRSKAEKG